MVIVDGKKSSQPKTARAGAYPHQLADAWAQVILEKIDRSNRDHEVLRSQMNHELVVAAETKKRTGKQVQTTAELLHFEEIRKADPYPERSSSSVKTQTSKQTTKCESGNKTKRKLTGSASSASSIRSSLPRHVQLKAMRVKDITLSKYKGCVEQFLQYALKQRWTLNSLDKTDIRLAEYFTELCEQGCAYNLASYTLFGYILLRTDVGQPDKNLYPRARAALKGWSSRFPQCSRTGADPLIWYLIANHMAEEHPALGAALLIQLDTYTRPSEVLALKKRDVVRPVSKLCAYWGIIIGNSDFDEFTKTTKQDDTILFSSHDRTYAPVVLKWVFQACRQRQQLLFEGYTLGQYEQAMKTACKAAGLAQFQLLPHCVRHSGPSVDFLSRARSPAEIQARGRWISQASIARYQKPGQLLSRMNKIPAEVWHEAQAALPSVLAKLKTYYNGGN